MQRQNQNSKKKIIIFTIVTLIVVIGVGVAAAYSLKIGPFAQKDNVSQKNEPASKEEQQQSSDAKLKAVEEDQAEKEQATDDPSTTPESAQASVAVEIPSAIENGDSIRLTTLIHTITNTGTCTLNIKKDTQLGYTSTVGVQPTSNTSTCKGFDVPTSQLGTGTWTATVTFTNDTLQGTASREFTIE